MDEKLLLEQIDAFVAENRENVLRDLKTLVDINSVEGQPQPGAPFGPGPKKAPPAARHAPGCQAPGRYQLPGRGYGPARRLW